ncbi:hypothetical protein [Planctomycetes bacterium Poly30]
MDKTPDTLDAILARRYHGAVNIRGIRYQVLYSILRALELYGLPTSASVRLEGIEDVDLLGFCLQNEFIQVKTAGKPWKWSQLGDPVEHFLEAHRADESTRFQLAVSFRLEKDIEKLACHESLSATEGKRIRAKFRELTSNFGATPQETQALLDGLSIVSTPEAQIRCELLAAITDRFELGSEAAETYLLVLVARFLGWAQERSTVTLCDLVQVRSSVGEALSREQHFQAYGRGLVTRLAWKEDAQTEDFYEGKQTRPGHIVASADIDRPRWIKRIEQAFAAGGVCVLKSSSGQGKSTLLYRFAHDHWPKENTFVLQAARTPEDAHAVISYLQHRAGVTLPTFLLIDNAGWVTSEWPRVVEQCVAVGIPVLLSVRIEDWYRFSKQSGTSYEVVEPTLDVQEAKAVFRSLRQARRVHKTVLSAEWAYEQIGTPHLLMEYVYLLTHGRMLEERLREQLQQFYELGEDPVKLEVLRRVALAATADCPVVAAKLLDAIETKDDVQHILDSLEGEYLVAEGETLRGLHRVRSSHLVELLHGTHASVERTAIAVLPAIPRETASTFIASVMSRGSVNTSQFIQALADSSLDRPLDEMRAVIEGVYEGGEWLFFATHRHLFDEAQRAAGTSGPTMLCTTSAPVIQVNILDQLSQLCGGRSPRVLRLRELASQFMDIPRGRDRVTEFLLLAEPAITSSRLAESLRDVGHVLDWFTLCGVRLTSWSNTQAEMLDADQPFRLALNDYCALSQGAYRYDESYFLQWFRHNRSRILSYLKYSCDCLTLDIVEQTLTVEFVIDSEGGDVNSQAVSRLASLRSAVPFCEEYRSRPIWALPEGLTPSADDGTKNLLAENNPSSSDVDKNALWRAVVEQAYLPDSYFVFEEAWFEARKAAVQFVEILSRVLERSLSGKKVPSSAPSQVSRQLASLHNCLQELPKLPPQTPAKISREFAAPAHSSRENPSQWVASLQNFLSQFAGYSEDNSKKDLARLASVNFYSAAVALPALHGAFDALFGVALDYFDARSLNSRELESYASLGELVDPWLVNPPATKPSNIRQWIQARTRKENEAAMARIRSATQEVENRGLVLSLPLGVATLGNLRYVPIGFEAVDPGDSGAQVQALAAALQDVHDLGDYFCLVPLYRGNRFSDRAHLLPSRKLSDFADGAAEQWEDLVPMEIPAAVLGQLWSSQLVPLHQLQVQATVAGLVLEVQCIHDLRGEVESRLSGDDDHFNLLHREQQLDKVAHRFSLLSEVASAALEEGDAMLDADASPIRELLVALAKKRWSEAERMVAEGIVTGEHLQALGCGFRKV